MTYFRVLLLALVSMSLSGCIIPVSPLMLMLLKNEETPIYQQEPNFDALPDFNSDPIFNENFQLGNRKDLLNA